jgi:hypothetical protein
MPPRNSMRDDVANKLTIVNNIIRKGFDYTQKNINNKYREYCNTIKGQNYFEIRESLMNELCPLVQNH